MSSQTQKETGVINSTINTVEKLRNRENMRRNNFFAETAGYYLLMNTKQSKGNESIHAELSINRMEM